jgi:hypothetical protein
MSETWSDEYDPFKVEHETRDRKDEEHKAQPNGPDQAPWSVPEPQSLTLAYWLSRDLPAPDFLFGEVISTTSRLMLVGPTGLGKTHIGLAVAVALVAGLKFLHWCVPAPRRVLYIDGEMSRRLMRARLEDAVRRAGCPSDAGLFIVSREDWPNMPPLNTEAGQKFIDAIIEAVKPALIIFDNIQSLLAGDMKDEEGWAQLLPWVRDLTLRHIGQVWVHHTGHDETHAYGTKTREWQLDTVALMERVDRPDLDIAFKLTFPKARERTPDNRSDFEPTIITLAADRWSSERGEQVKAKRPTKDHALELLQDAITREGAIPPANEHIPPNKLCVTIGLWRGYCKAAFILASDKDNTFRSAFSRASKRLVDAGLVRRWDLWVWIVRS